MRHERVIIKRSTETTHNRSVPPWEIPVLEYLFDPGNVEPLGQYIEVSGEYPSAETELARLIQAYGADPKSGIPHASSVFGNGRKGTTELRKLIEAAKAEEIADSKVPAKPAAPTRRARREHYERDSLLS
jgi:hypothetical protein